MAADGAGGGHAQHAQVGINVDFAHTVLDAFDNRVTLVYPNFRLFGATSCSELLVELSNKSLSKPFGRSHANQMLVSLADAELVYKNRHGKYSFAVPLLGKFILRQMEHADRKLL